MDRNDFALRTGGAIGVAPRYQPVAVVEHGDAALGARVALPGGAPEFAAGLVRPRGQVRREGDRLSQSAGKVYGWCMSRTNIDIDDQACAAIMRRYRLGSKREAVNLALRTLAAEPLSLVAARRLRGSGWEGDLDEMRGAGGTRGS